MRNRRAQVVAEYRADVARLLALIRQQALTTRGPSPLDDLIDEQFDVLRRSLPDRIKYRVSSAEAGDVTATYPPIVAVSPGPGMSLDTS